MEAMIFMDFSHLSPSSIWTCIERRIHVSLDVVRRDGHLVALRIRETWPCDRGSCGGFRPFPGKARDESPRESIELSAEVSAVLLR
jgi:hypothetical protein